MPRRDLKNKPLVEAILEIKWHLLPQESEHSMGSAQVRMPPIDPHYKLLLGRLFDRFQTQYPVHEALPTANLPDEVVGHMVQHRFRAAKNDWPLVQVGPGIFTVNDTHKYTWTDFSQRIKDAAHKLFDAHPNVGDLSIESLMLRYVDAVEFDYSEQNAFCFLRDNLKLEIGLPQNLFEGTGVRTLPTSSQWQATFECEKPKGRVHVSFATGQRNEKPAILWETTVQSAGDDLPDMPEEFPVWIEAAHNLTDDWFFKLIEGDLERRFDGD